MKLLNLLLAFSLLLSCRKSQDITPVTPVTPVISDSVHNNNDLSWLKGTWIGPFNQLNYGTYQMIMFVDSIHQSQFFGTMQFPSLRNSIVTMEGYESNDTLYWTETALLQGSGIVLHGKYVSVVNDKTKLTGDWYYPNSSKGGTYSIDKQ